MVDQDGGRITLPGPAAGDVQSQPGSGDRGPGRRVPRGWQVKNWRMRWRVLALIVLPTAAAIALGGLRIQAAQSTAAAASRTSQLGVLGSDITALTESVEDERDLTAGYVATRLAGESALMTTIFARLTSQYTVTDGRLRSVEQLAGQIGPAYPAVARSDLTFALSSLSALSELRVLAHTEMSSLPLINHYSNVVATLLAFDSDLADGSSSAQLAQTVTSLQSLVQTQEEASAQRGILYAALLEGQFEPGAQSALAAAQSSQASALASFQRVAGSLPAFVPPSGLSPLLTETQQFNDIVAGPDVDAALATEMDDIVGGGAGPAVSGDPQAWFADMSFALGTMRTVESDELSSVVAQAGALQQGAQNSEKLTAVVVLVLLVLILIVTIAMARSMIRPLRRLRTDALDVAGHRLPDMVRRLSDSQEASDGIQIDPIGIDSTDEIGEVARAFDRVHSEAVRLAGEEAQLRANLNAMFVNLSRRSQTLIERQLSIIDSLEQSEQDADRLSSLFRLDHLATRMRRNSENLLVLAGHEAPRKWSQPVPLVDVLRAAISEIEQYDRITLQVQPGVVIAGRAASDVVHLAAELVENAATFSPADTRVVLTGQLMTSGGVLIEIVDEGLGIPDQDLQYANWRLDNPPVIDVAVSRRMGLFVVGRLAARHGIRVRLRHAFAGGLSALIWLPEAVAEAEKAPPLNRLGRRRFDADNYAPDAQIGGAAGIPAITITGRRPTGWAWDTGRGRLGPRPEPDTQAVAVAADGAAQEQEPAGGAATADGSADRRPLPIFEAVESDWFRRGGKRSGRLAEPPTASWTSPADEGFRAAMAAASPAIGETTATGLPRRVPSANLIPGSVGGEQQARSAEPPGRPGLQGRPGPADGRPQAARARGRSAEEMRERLANFQRGAREGRAAAPWDYGADEN